MSASAFASQISPEPLVIRSDPPALKADLARRARWTRLLRRLADCRHLRETNARLMRDVGLTCDDMHRGMPFRAGIARPPGLIRLGILDARDCRLKLYALAAEAAGLRREDVAAARRAFSAVLAGRAWQRHVAHPSPSTLAACLAKDCA